MIQGHKNQERVEDNSDESGVYLSEIPQKGKMSKKMRTDPKRKKSLWPIETEVHESSE